MTEVVIVVLVLTTVAFACIIGWLLWTRTRIRTSIQRTQHDNDSTRRTTRLDAEIFVETYRKRREVNRSSMGTSPSPRQRGR
jgi:hypothetical protein